MRATSAFSHEDVKYFNFGYNPISKPTLFSFIFYIDGLLIDTGQAKMRKQIQQTLAELDVDQIFITHHHEDHSGNIEPLKNQFDCPVYAPNKCCDLMKAPPPLSFAQKLVWGSRPAYRELKPEDYQIKTNQYNFEIIPIPGHAPDMVALFEREKGWLFSADLYINAYIGYYLKDESIAQQIQSIKTVLALDFEVMFCSHNLHFDNGKEVLKNKLQYLQDFSGKVVRLHQQGLKPKEIFKSLGLKEHGFINLISHGELSKLNMVKSAVRDYENGSLT
ncbi:MBL fold metallo-hydrolase [Fulvivirga sp. RKSG066]|uniref:MBL fold metallo-hydrolase n=1 Tax=Fulvivirga aurantia TaxID=2529383 RepID=UPI0012BD8072|nr:MBL fold metallo-hydrolase [Fulvivirga aurantia]MTI22926.1 MBL fold metallo-hydrolase [Fulvivirga aurantia]